MLEDQIVDTVDFIHRMRDKEGGATGWRVNGTVEGKTLIEALLAYSESKRHA